MHLKSVTKFVVGGICIGNRGVGRTALNYTTLSFKIMPSSSADMGKVGTQNTSVPFVIMLNEVW
jgi:hypothetical protein